MPSNVSRHICILAAKDLRRNTRVCRQAKALTSAGWRVTVAALELPDALPEACERYRIVLPHPLQRLESKGPSSTIGTASAPTPPPRPRPLRRHAAAVARAGALPFGHVINSVLFARACRAIDAPERFDIIQAHDAPALRAARALAIRSGAPLVYDAVEFVDSRPTVGNGLAARLVRRCESALEARLVRRAAATFAIGPSMRDWMAHRYAIDPPTIVRNCREYEAAPTASRLRADAGIPAGGRVVLLMNSVAPDRGVEELLRAVTLLPTEIHVVVLAPPARSAYMEKLNVFIADLGLSQRVHFLPPVSPWELIGYAGGADVGVIPFLATSQNHYLALPNRIFELIMARVPIVASDFPDMHALITEFDVGRTVDPTHAAALAAAITELLQTASQTRLRERLEHAATVLSWEHESLAYLRRLEQVAPSSKLSRAPLQPL